MASGLLSLKWNNHRSTFFHILSSIRSKESYCDATLACDGRFYPVHKLVLSTCSDYFEEMFEKTQCKHPVIVLKDIKFDDLEALLNYMYVGEVNVLQERLSTLIKAAECLKIKGLAVPDEDPSISEESKKNRHSDHASPHAKRRRRHRSHSEDKDKSSHNKGSRESHSRNSIDSAENFVSNNSRVGHNDNFEHSAVEAATSKGSNLGKRSFESSDIKIPEVYLDEIDVKTEPPDNQDPEEITESKESIHSELNFDPTPGESLAEGDIEGSISNEEYTEDVMTPQSVEDVVAQAMPSSSNFQGNSFPWEGEGSLQNFPDDSYGGENSQGRQMMVMMGLSKKDEESMAGCSSSGWMTRPPLQHVCSHCDKAFSFSRDLKRHIRTHTDGCHFSKKHTSVCLRSLQIVL